MKEAEKFKRLQEAHDFIERIARFPDGLPEMLVFAAKEFLKGCRHEVIHQGYGLGFGPMGVYELCELCGKHLAHSPDPEGITPEQYASEVEWCKKNGLREAEGFPWQRSEQPDMQILHNGKDLPHDPRD